MSKLKNIGTCIGLAGGITAFILCILVGNTQFVRYLWVGFLSMIIYFAAGGDRDWKLCGRMICTFACGLGWGFLSNTIYVTVFGNNSILAAVLDYFVVVFLLLWVHIGLLSKTPFNFVPTAFLGLALSIGFYGRPFPYAGQGLAGNMSPAMITLYLFFYVVFGLVFSLMINYITILFAKIILKPTQKERKNIAETEN
jgi:hypothetical protein